MVILIVLITFNITNYNVIYPKEKKTCCNINIPRGYV